MSKRYSVSTTRSGRVFCRRSVALSKEEREAVERLPSESPPPSDSDHEEDGISPSPPLEEAAPSAASSVPQEDAQDDKQRAELASGAVQSTCDLCFNVFPSV